MDKNGSRWRQVTRALWLPYLSGLMATFLVEEALRPWLHPAWYWAILLSAAAGGWVAVLLFFVSHVEETWPVAVTPG